MTEFDFAVDPKLELAHEHEQTFRLLFVPLSQLVDRFNTKAESPVANRVSDRLETLENGQSSAHDCRDSSFARFLANSSRSLRTPARSSPRLIASCLTLFMSACRLATPRKMSPRSSCNLRCSASFASSAARRVSSSFNEALLRAAVRASYRPSNDELVSSCPGCTRLHEGPLTASSTLTRDSRTERAFSLTACSLVSVRTRDCSVRRFVSKTMISLRACRRSWAG